MGQTRPQGLHNLFKRVAHSHRSAVEKTQKVMSGRGKGGKGLEEMMLSAARRGWSGIPVWASDEEVQAVRERHPEVFGKRSPSPPLQPFMRRVRLSGDALEGSPADAPMTEEDDDKTAVGDFQDFDELSEREDPGAALQHGLSVVTVERHGVEKWFSERYNVRDGYVRDMCFRLKVTPILDAFADAGNHRFPLWWEDAFAEKWPQDKVIWANPPFSIMHKVVQKIKEDHAKVLLVCPDWRSCAWCQQLHDHVMRKYFYAKGTPVYELDKKKVEGIKWGLWAYYVDGSVSKEEEFMEENKEYSVSELAGEWQETTSSKRRQRRKWQKQGGQ